MGSLITLAQSMGLAYLSGVSLYATVALLGVASQAGWIGPLPGALNGLVNPFVIGIAAVLAVIEFLATLIPGVASLWETAHTFIRPPAAAALAAVAVDTSPEPVTNGLLNTAELSVIASLTYLVWHHPVAALVVALLLLILTAMLVRMVWRALRNLFSGHWRSFFPEQNKTA